MESETWRRGLDDMQGKLDSHRMQRGSEILSFENNPKRCLNNWKSKYVDNFDSDEYCAIGKSVIFDTMFGPSNCCYSQPLK